MTVRIRKDDQRNTRDILEFLTEAAGEEILAARLAEARMDPDGFVSMLAERCEGVWVYLRYVLDELRIGLRRPDVMDDLPSGLWNYYAAQIRRWQRDAAWDEFLLPLLATLGVEGEPLPAAALARLAGNLDPVTVRRWCDTTFRPLLNTTYRTGTSTPLRYEIYHASFREALKALHTDRPGEFEHGRYELEALADELRQASVAAQARIADTYLGCFGGLAAGLPKLSSNSATADIDDGYPLRHLARHLQYAGRVTDLHRLLAVAHLATSGRESNVWFAAHDHADSLVSYLDDLARAQNDSATVTDQALIRHQLAPALGTEIRYALMAASVASRTARIHAELLELLIRTGMWSPGRGLDHARRLTEPINRLHALIVVHPNVNAVEQPRVLAEALAAATTITSEGDRSRALITLAPHLPPDLLPQALAAATAIINDGDRADALTTLAPHLSYDEQTDALAQALAAATAIINDYDRADALTALAPHLPPSLLPKALAAATAITRASARARALAALAPRLPADQQADVLAQALAAASHHRRLSPRPGARRPGSSPAPQPPA